MTLKIILKGGKGSGYRGHTGSPGRGGSTARGSGGAISNITTDVLQYEHDALRKVLKSQTHSLSDVASGRYPVGVEGSGGEDVKAAKELGLYVRVVNGVEIFSATKRMASDMEKYLLRGGTYGTAEFSRLLGYTESQIDEYVRFIDISDELRRRAL